MPCKDAASNMIIRLDHQDRFISFEFSKMTGGSLRNRETGFQHYCRGKNVFEILDYNFPDLVCALHLEKEEQQYILYLEWDALRASLAVFFGIEKTNVDSERCLITSVQHDEDGITISEIILPPRDLPELAPRPA
ncbi:MAG: hypothetical protein KBB26_02115 [Candidatus Omnitrophica bacterium]|nr:hypothetical protein [Candidatus Omnitrophota bacterium]